MSRNETPPDLLELRRRAQRAIARAEWAEAERLLGEHARRDEHGDPAALAPYRQIADGRGARNALPYVLAFCDKHPQKAQLPEVRLERGLALQRAGQLQAARRELNAVRERLRDPHARALAENGLGSTFLEPFDPVSARRAFERSRAIAAEANLLDRVAAAEINLGLVEIQAGTLERAASHFRAALDRAASAGDAGLERLACYNLGNCLHDLGRSATARKLLSRAKEASRARDEPWHEGWATLILGELARKQGRLDDAEARFEETERLFRAAGGPTATESGWIALRRAEVLVDRGDLRRAARLARAADVEGVDLPARLAGRLLAARIAAERSPSSRSVRLLREIAADAERAGLVDVAWRARVSAARTTAEVAAEAWLDGRGAPADAVREDVERAQALLEGVLSRMRASGRRLYLRDHVRRSEAQWLARAVALSGKVEPGAPRAFSAARRRAWLRLLSDASKLASARTPEAVVEAALEAILEATGAERAWLRLNASASGPAVDAGRDAAGGELPPDARPARGAREVSHEGREVGALLVEGARAGQEGAELADAIAHLAWPLVEGARARAALASASRDSEEQTGRLELELARVRSALRDASDRETALDVVHRGMIGRSAVMREMFARIDRIASASLPVLVTGESGTGKELVARAIHDGSPRATKPFVAVNCGALADSLLESELFGHVRGAFTGAERDKPGLFSVAQGGTLLLDELGEMSLAMQTKLLRVLQDGEVRPVGGTRTQRVDVRVVAATNRDLAELVRQGRFREDLLFRLEVLTVRVPPLRARGDDVLLLARHFLARVDGRKRIAPRAAAQLVARAWPGNVRELKATVEAAAVLSPDDVLDAAAFETGASRRTAPRPRGSDPEGSPRNFPPIVGVSAA